MPRPISENIHCQQRATQITFSVFGPYIFLSNTVPNYMNSDSALKRFTSSPKRPDRVLCSDSVLFHGYRRLFPGDKAAGAWRWPLSSTQYRG